MKNTKLFYLLSFLTITVFLLGCTATKQETKSESDSLRIINRDKALEHFVNGNILDLKCEYANAILEYQEALIYDKNAAIYHALSRDYMLLKKYALAAQAAREAIAMEPNNKTYRQNLAEIFINAGEFDNAINAHHEIIKLDSNNFNAWFTLARLYQLKKPLKALEIYTQIVKRFGPSLEVSIQMAELYRLNGKIDEAIIALNDILKFDPSNADLKKTIAEFYMTAGKNDSALALYNEVVDLFPSDIESRAAMTHIYLINRNYQKASEQFEIVLSGDVISIEDQLRFGQIFLAFLQKDSAIAPFAITLFEKIQKQYSDDWRPYWFLGVLSSIIRQDSAAIINFEKVTELNNNNPDGWVYLASVYYDNRDFPRVIKILESAKKFVLQEFRVHLILGIAYQRTNMLDSSANALSKALQIDSTNLDAMSALALVYDDLKKYDKSDSLYEKALRLYPGNHLLLNNYAYSLSVRGIQLDRALEMAKEAIHQQPKNSSYLDTIGWIYFMLGDYKEAEKFILAAINEGDVSTEVLEHLGDVYYKLSNQTKALEYWNKALEKDKGNKSVQEKISRGSL